MSFAHHLQNSLSTADGELSLGNSLLLIDWKCMGNLYWSDTAANTLPKTKQSNKTICIMSKNQEEGRRGEIDSSKQIYNRHLRHPWCSARQKCESDAEPHHVAQRHTFFSQISTDWHSRSLRGNLFGLSQDFLFPVEEASLQCSKNKSSKDKKESACPADTALCTVQGWGMEKERG